MRIELCCPTCPCRFCAHPDTPADALLDRLINEGLWFGLAEGNTFEDMIFAAVLARGAILCPECGSAMSIGEESLTRPLVDDPFR